MKLANTLQKKAFSYALEHANNLDPTVALTSMLTLYLSAVNNEALQKTFLENLHLFEERRRNGLVINDPKLLLQYIIIYQKEIGTIPKDLHGFIKKYDDALSNTELDTQLLFVYLLVKKITNSLPEEKSTLLHLESDIANINTAGVAFLLNTIEKETYFGNLSITNSVSPKIIALLEVDLIEACRHYNIEKVSRLLQNLSYLKAPKSMAIDSAIQFLIHNQSPKGFIGYYEKDFANLSEHHKINKTLIRLSSTRVALRGILAYHYNFELHKSAGNHEMELISTSVI